MGGSTNGIPGGRWGKRLAGALFFLVGILTLPAQESGSSRAENSRSGEGGTTADPAILPANYRVQPSDQLLIEVFRHPDLEKVSRVEADGTITLHLIGRIEVEGMTVAEIRDEVTELYNRDYLVDPQLDVYVTDFSLAEVQVMGEVREPGTVQIPPDDDLTLLEAIVESGGFTALARRNSVQIRRKDGDDQTEVIRVNAKDLLDDPEAEQFLLQDGDIIYVRERIL